MNFPKFLIFSQGNKIVKIFSFEHFEEYTKMGGTYFHQNFQVKTHADRLYVMDLLNSGEVHFIDEIRYETVKNEMISSLKHMLNKD